MGNHTGSRPFILVLLVGVLYCSYLIVRPFLHAIILAFLIGALLAPLKNRLEARLGGRSSLAGLLIITGVVFLILVPLLFFLSALISQTVETVIKVNQWVQTGGLQKMLDNPGIHEWLMKIQVFSDRFSLDLPHIKSEEMGKYVVKITQHVGQFIISQGTSFLGNAVQLAMQFVVMVFFMFYVVRDYELIIRRLKDLLPLKEEQEDRIFERIREVARSALLGTLVTACAQGVAGGIGLAIVGIPALFWGTMMGFMSLIPVLGMSVIWLPSAGYLFLLGKWKLAIFLVIWCVVIVGSIDNFLRPFFMRGTEGMSTFFIFIAVIGGVQYFGLLGVVYGPLILGCLLVVLYIYEAEYREMLTHDADSSIPSPQRDHRADTSDAQ